MAKSNQITYKEAPLGIGSPSEKKAESVSNDGGAKGQEVKKWGMPQGDGAGNMSTQNPDAGTVTEQSMGSIVPKGKHSKECL